jgi:MFS family permease
MQWASAEVDHRYRIRCLALQSWTRQPLVWRLLPWQVLIARAAAWLGRGVHTAVRKALLAAAVERSVYGRAFGFERAIDTLGAIVGPLTALWLLALFPGKYRIVFALTLLPGLVAAVLIGLVVQEKERVPVQHASFGERLRSLPKPYRQLLWAVGIFGAGAIRPHVADSLGRSTANAAAAFSHCQSGLQPFCMPKNLFIALR